MVDLSEAQNPLPPQRQTLRAPTNMHCLSYWQWLCPLWMWHRLRSQSLVHARCTRPDIILSSIAICTSEGLGDQDCINQVQHRQSDLHHPSCSPLVVEDNQMVESAFATIQERQTKLTVRTDQRQAMPSAKYQLSLDRTKRVRTEHCTDTWPAGCLFCSAPEALKC